ncbi:UDP-4-amino-4,6-dideoxy-N-acetyl-beta-L-altrosamine N-acetyltransferase [Bacillus tuaregi]|uniref:UDP-4-amino-4, 6-dideoxy-N-acetyl-beta-L-altrosamine N-acetyltransferase n=1 Tax=Bacillus tuaregi TaxID=1816695 RepID=UPI0008F8C06A|nr:UDP-4-amino-4,6-dideoxy-N-acetyl-beta-L-altrosamine N-acetyltransferase [Bacillus tuaregi]
MSYTLRALTNQDKDLLYSWRNAKFIRVNMYHDEVIPYEHHCQWFNKVLLNQKEYYRLFCDSNRPLGLISFKEEVGQNKVFHWGFYIGETQTPKGSGTWMGYLGLDYAFHTLGANCIVGEVFDFNQKSAAFHLKLGFQQDLPYQHTFFRKEQPFQVLRFILTKEDWELHREKVNLSMT